ncbi:MAG: hypothetical protein WB579_10045 [Bryobacteraceae bacterium]
MPRPETVDQALEEIGKSAANYRYFFEKLNFPTWLAPLKAKGRFRNPPHMVAVEGGVMFPPWPESQYLARMARIPAAQREVLDIVQAMPDTDNINVHNDLLDIALALPPNLASSLVGKARSWIQTPYHGLVKYHIGDLIAHLASGGETNAALQLARDTFSLLPNAPREEGSLFSPEPRAWIEDWHYDEALKKAIPPLTTADGERTIQLCCDLLVRALELSRSAEDERHMDYSYIWHEAIEDDEYPPRLRNTLVSAVRNTAEQMISQAPENLRRALGVLRRYDWPVFKRLELHVLRRFADIGIDEVVAVLPSVVEVEGPTHHEAALLMKTAFGRLPRQVQEELLRRIDNGPEKADVVAWLGDQATPQGIAEFGNYWRAQRYSLIADQLPAEWETRAREVMGRAGRVRALDEVNRGATWVGPSSPKNADDLRQLGPDGVLAFLRDWQPNPGPMESTPEGLGRVLQEVIAKDPEAYVARAEECRHVDPTFVRFFLSGLEGASKESRAFAWQPVLDLAAWVVAQPREIPGRKRVLMEADPDWAWTRGTIATLLEEGMREKPGTIAIAHRAAVWGILLPLTDDPDPNLEYEAKYGGSNMEPSTLAINTVRGKAFNAVIAYALWVRRHLDRQEDKPAMTLDVMPEVREVLDDHLDLGREPTLTIRSVYGRYFPWLYHLDPLWAAGAVRRVFPTEQALAPYWVAAWDAYVTFCGAYDVVLPLLRDEYLRAITVQPPEESKHGRHDQREFLAHHLMTFYWRGTIRTDDVLATTFFGQAPDDVRAYAIAYIGRSLANASEAPPNILARLRELWEWRLQTARASHDAMSYRHELAQFGWWFVSRKYDDAWGLEQLRAVLDLTGLAEPDFKVSEILEALATTYPLACVQCISRIAQADRQGWTTLASRDHFQAILKAAIASDNRDAKNAATQLIEYLVGRGDFEYRKLLS